MVQQAEQSLANQPLISAKDIVVKFKDNLILNDVNLDIYKKEILGFIGPSGGGKSVLMRTLLGLTEKSAGFITIAGKNMDLATEEEKKHINMRMGVLFQNGALFSSLTILENIQMPMRKYLSLPEDLLRELALLKIAMVGLAPDAAQKYPTELSGGMVKRAALARALALDPDIIFLDEPTSGLDPISAAAFDELILNLRDMLGLTVYMITHDLDSLYTICDRIVILGDKSIKAGGNLKELLKNEDPWIKSYFHGKRAQQRF